MIALSLDETEDSGYVGVIALNRDITYKEIMTTRVLSEQRLNM